MAPFGRNALGGPGDAFHPGGGATSPFSPVKADTVGGGSGGLTGWVVLPGNMFGSVYTNSFGLGAFVRYGLIGNGTPLKLSKRSAGPRY